MLLIDLEIFSRDVPIAFIRSKNQLNRRVYVKTPKRSQVLEQIGAQSGSILQAVKRQYGFAESPGYWWQTFQDWYITNLGMTSTFLDLCLFYKKSKSGLEGIQVVQFGDICGGGTNDFAILEPAKPNLQL